MFKRLLTLLIVFCFYGGAISKEPWPPGWLEGAWDCELMAMTIDGKDLRRDWIADDESRIVLTNGYMFLVFPSQSRIIEYRLKGQTENDTGVYCIFELAQQPGGMARFRKMRVAFVRKANGRPEEVFEYDLDGIGRVKGVYKLVPVSIETISAEIEKTLGKDAKGTPILSITAEKALRDWLE